jgi:uncharacterized GH25 family protein
MKHLRGLSSALAGVACATLLAGSAFAHDIVLVPSGKNELVVRYGHPGDWHRVEERRLVDLVAYADAGPGQARLSELRPVPAGFGKPPLDLRLSDRGSSTRLLSAQYDNGYWARVPVPGQAKPFTRNTTRTLLPEAAVVTNNLKFAKGLVLDAQDTAVFQRRVGHLLEIVPQKNPATLAAGEPLPVLVLLGGQPLAGAQVEVGNLEDAVEDSKIVRHATNAAGVAQVALRPKGVNAIAVGAERPNDGSLLPRERIGGADRLALVATFTFVRP